MAPSTTARPRSTARALLDPHPCRPADRALPHPPGRHHRGARAHPRGAARPGVHRAARRARQAGLREPRRAALACSARPRPGPARSCVSWRRPLCLPAGVRGGARAGRALPLFTCKPSSHQTLQEYLTGIDLPEHVERVKRGKQRFTHRYRWLCEVPLRGDAEALTVNWLQIEILDAAGAVPYRNSFVTDLPVDASSVAELAACGRARWKIENESFNVLKTGGYHLEHNFGHGTAHLSALLACLNLLAFAIHTVCDQAEGAWRKARTTLGPRVRFFQNLQALTSYLVFSSWTELLHTLAFARPPPSPSG